MRTHITTLHEGEELARGILEAVPGGVVHVARDGSIRNANREALRILGALDEITKRDISDFDPETILEDGSPCQVVEYLVTKILATGKPAGPTTIGVRRPDGALYWAVFRAEPVVGSDGELAGAVVTFIDVTACKQTEEALRRSEEKWRTLSANLPDFVILVDREARILSVNRIVPELTETQVLGRKTSEFTDPAFVDEWMRHLEEALATRQTRRFETRGLGLEGKIGWYETVIVPMPDGDRALVVAQDVTERRALLTSFAERDRLASIGMLAASVAHEIMNPLTYVLANLELVLADESGDAQRRRKALEDAREGAARMQQIVRDLRALGRSGSEELFCVDVRSVLDIAVRLAGPVAAQGSIVLEFDPVPGVLASESRLCQVFLNLIVNAAQALEGARDGVVRVRTRHDEATGRVAVDIQDTGAGIAPESLPRIFEPFYTTKRAGTGLGLSICRDIVERMGGSIDVKSSVGEGSTFTVWLSTTRATLARLVPEVEGERRV